MAKDIKPFYVVTKDNKSRMFFGTAVKVEKTSFGFSVITYPGTTRYNFFHGERIVKASFNVKRIKHFETDNGGYYVVYYFSGVRREYRVLPATVKKEIADGCPVITYGKAAAVHA